ncbi:MAG: septation protein IspZ [Pseudomonadales bacterium]|nr:septation protein IspZ [Pseudomonadales bacterium]
MKQLLDFSPVIAFVIAYFSTRDFKLATMVIIGASAIQIAISWSIWKKVERMHWITFLILVVLGGLTLAFDDERFLKWKPTIVNWLFAAALLGSQIFAKRNFLQRIIEGMLKNTGEVTLNVPQKSWGFLNVYASLFFILAGFINLHVAFNYDTDTWVTFKLVGLTGLNLAGMIALFSYLFRYMKQNESESVNDNKDSD